jgi:tetratricopeptide (TPR) repeat protein
VRFAIVLLLIAGIAHADRASDARKLFDDGRQQYKAKDYETAAIKFDAAYALDPDPAYLNNAGLAYLKAEKCSEAADRFQRYLAIDPPNRKKVEADLAEAKACAPTETTPDQPDQPDRPERPPPPLQPPPKRSLIAPVALGVTGALLVGVGIAFTVKVSGVEKDRAAICPAGCTWDDDKDARAKDLTRLGERDSKIAIGTYIAGSLAIAGGIAIYVTSKPKSRETRITVAPSTGGGLVIGRVRF